MTTSSDPLANRLGALALRITDRMHVAVGSGGRSLSSATALSALHRFLDRPSIDQLSSVLGLSSSATVRLVDGLVADGLATRASSKDGRVSVVKLTTAGRRQARRIVAARAAVLEDVLTPLSARERATLHELVEKVLIGLVRGPATKGWMCRLCDTRTCGAEPGQPCPITTSALTESQAQLGPAVTQTREPAPRLPRPREPSGTPRAVPAAGRHRRSPKDTAGR